MNRDENGWIGTHTGTKFWPLEPAASEVHIEDIAHSLARQCRFNGHCRGFYSVAEHSIEVSRHVPRAKRFALWGLLHDAAEAYLSDLVRPIKAQCHYQVPTTTMRSGHRLQTYRECEAQIQRCIADRFCLDFPIPTEVDDADNRMLVTERSQLFNENQPHWDALDGVEPYLVKLQCLNWQTAEMFFLNRFQELNHG